MSLSMLCDQCSMSAPNGCGAKGQIIGTCGKDANLAKLQNIMIYGLKGLSAYRVHANEFGANTKEVDDVIAQTLYFTLTNVNFNFDDHIAQLMKIGQAGIKMMDILTQAHTSHLGVPTPVSISQNKAQGKAILVSGHNLDMLLELLKQTQDKGINIYTHSEMLPAHAYPELRKFPHLKGNIGKSWFDQTHLFEKWNGTIIVNTNCIVPPTSKATYIDRLYSYDIVGIKEGKKIHGNDFSEVIAQTLLLPDITGFDSDEVLVTGHHYQTILTLAPQILEAISAGKISQFFVIAGCDAPGKGGEYYHELAQSLPNDCVILTSSCGKFRFNDIDFGMVENTNIPRYLDLGQCNDSNGAIHIAIALANALGVSVHELPVSIVLSWMEQKAVLILLALFSLGIQNIYLGPKPPQFVNDDIFEFLQNNFNLHLTGEALSDKEKLLIKKSR